MTIGGLDHITDIYEEYLVLMGSMHITLLHKV